MHPFVVERLAEAKLAQLIVEADAARIAARRGRGTRRRGLGIAERITRRRDRRRARDLAY
ncbi:MAG: hypothetical protein ACLGIB_00415 [Actinomycetota bacterium]